MTKRFDGKVALITGAGGGIGHSVVTKLVEGGARVALADVSAESAERMSAEIQAGGGQAIALPGDLTDGDYCDSLPGLVVEALGGLDILINNAGLMRRGPVTEASDEDFALSMAVNVEAPFRLVRAAIPLMEKAGGGTIVNTASCWGLYPGPDHLVYCTTKAAIAAMTRCLGRDHAHQNIRVNAVCPNEVNTPMLRTGFSIRGLDPDTAIADLNATVPLGRIAEPEDIADVIAFLASDDSRYMCGALLEVNGAKPVF
ncbi:SDR family NAD(P)-dependent oxidoreductase [Coralliovum pocilloporae]|uniref:SDR family NAD(P)-dependent oxidoreductase n=1 Tax=Coralliovum pocilloporae TaxID=3066369 RepID=UPI00330707DF